MHMREPRFRLAQSGSEGSKISGGALMPAWTHQPVCYDLGDPYLQTHAHQIPSSPAPQQLRGKDPRLASEGSWISVAGGPVPPSLKNWPTAGEEEAAPRRGGGWGGAPLPSPACGATSPCSVSYLVHRSPRRSCSHVRCGRPAWPVRRSGCPAEPETKGTGMLLTMATCPLLAPPRACRGAASASPQRAPHRPCCRRGVQHGGSENRAQEGTRIL